MKQTARKTEKKLMATLDIGAHSARMLIAEVNTADRTFVALEDLAMPVPLGSNVFRRAMISDEAIQILCGILRNFKQKMEEYGVTHYRAIATSAVREAGNAEIFIERIYHATGIAIKIFDGTDEARLDYIATLSEVPARYGFQNKQALIADIGTGACQVSAYDCGQLCFTETLKVGTLRALEIMPDTLSSTAMVQYVSALVDKSFSELEHISGNIKAQTIIALGSSVRTLLKLLSRRAVIATSISRQEFRTLRATVLNLSIPEVCEQYKLRPDLAETIAPCCMILENLLRLTDAQSIVIPMASTKNVLLRDFINTELGVKDPFDSQIHNLIQRTAAKYFCANNYSDLVCRFAEQLFLKLEKLHGLSHRELLILKIAARLHKSGLFINNQAYHKHSYYIILNTEIPGISMTERKIAALIARYHRKAEPKILHPEYNALTCGERSVVNKLASILRIACGLAAMSSMPENLNVKIEPDRIVLRIGDGISRFTESTMEIDTNYFRSVFARKVVFY